MFSTKKIIDRATQKNKIQKYIRIYFTVPLKPFNIMKVETKYAPNVKPIIHWYKTETLEDEVKSQSFSVDNCRYMKQWRTPDVPDKNFSEAEINFHKFCEQNRLTFNIWPTGEDWEEKSYFNDNYHMTRRRGEVVMLNFFQALTADYDNVLFSDDMSICDWTSDMHKWQYEFYLWVPEWSEKTPTEIKSLLNEEIKKHDVFEIFEDLYHYTIPTMEFSIKNATPRKNAKNCDFSKPLKDQYGIDIEKGDIVAYPHGDGGRNFYGLRYGKVELWTGEFIKLDSGTQRRHDKLLVIHTDNPNKKLAFQLEKNNNNNED